MKLYLVTGFLGSGKSTAIQKACVLSMEKNKKVAVITNDQGEQLVDSKFFQSASIPYREVAQGCFCCNYNQLTSSISSLLEVNEYEIIFAESVGSCTDLVATITKPLNIQHPEIQISISVFADALLLYPIMAGNACFLDESVQYIFRKQFEEADILIINKIDLLGPEQLLVVKKIVDTDYPGKVILYQNSLDKNSIRNWLKVLSDLSIEYPRKSLQLDYDLYAQGEAKLAWMDQHFKLTTMDGTAGSSAFRLAEKIYNNIKTAGYPIGHLKFLISNGTRSTKISYTTSDHPVQIEYVYFPPANSISVLMNARVQTTAEGLQDLITNTVHEFQARNLLQVSAEYSTAFLPGYPTPTFRLSD